MNKIESLEKWGDAHHPKYLDVIRMLLGIFLCWKGIDFLRNMGVMNSLISERLSYGSFTVVLLGHYVVFAHILGGIFMAMGILTRFGCLIQIPIIIGAIIFVNSQDMFKPYSEMFLSILILLLLIYFLIVGNGRWAINFFDKSDEKNKYI